MQKWLKVIKRYIYACGFYGRGFLFKCNEKSYREIGKWEAFLTARSDLDFYEPPKMTSPQPLSTFVRGLQFETTAYMGRLSSPVVTRMFYNTERGKTMNDFFSAKNLIKRFHTWMPKPLPN